MADLVARWRGLSAAWKGFVIGFAVLMIYFTVIGFVATEPIWAVLTAIIWAGAFAGVVRLWDRMRMPPGR
jgi:hypothetical protein